MIKLNKMYTPEVFKKGVAITGIAASLLPIINSKKQEKTSTNVLDYMDKSPVAISNKAFSEMSNPIKDEESFSERMERRLKMREVELSEEENYDDFWESFTYESTNCIEDKAVYEELSDKVNNPNIKKILEILFSKNFLYENTAEILYDMDVKSRNIKDKTVLAKLEQLYNEIITLKSKDSDLYSDSSLDGDSLIHEAYQIIEAYNTIKGNYVQYKMIELFNTATKNQENLSKTQEYLEARDIDTKNDDNVKLPKNRKTSKKVNLRENIKKRIFDNKKTDNLEVEDFLWAQKCEAFEELKTEPELKKYLYGILLKELKLPVEAEKTCKEMLNDFGVMVIPSLVTEDINLELNAVKRELSAWATASNSKVKLPEIISLNSIKKEFLFTTAGRFSQAQDIITLRNGFLKTIISTLRHEIMHKNDLLEDSFGYVGEDLVQLLAEIMPIRKEGKYKVRDYDNCKYREEFLKAGLQPKHIKYAYKKRAEFIAVASEGNMSRYSPEFKEVLIKLGMPSYVLNLENISADVARNCRIYDEVIKANPDVKDYEQLKRLCEETSIEDRKKNAARLFKMVFGDC